MVGMVPGSTTRLAGISEARAVLAAVRVARSMLQTGAGKPLYTGTGIGNRG